MNNLNSILVEGNFVRDPELKNTHGGAAVCKFSIATTRSYRSGEGFEKEVSFFDVEAWAKLAEAVGAKGKKGRGCRVVGRLKQERWNDKEGKARSRIIIVAEHVDFMPEFKKDGQQNESNNSSPPADEDIPF
jgi:single-strand DNA-binding protein